jgi:hypothetical protein
MVVTTATANSSLSSITTHLKNATVAFFTAIKSAFIWTFTTLKAACHWIWHLISTTILAIVKAIKTAAKWTWSKLCSAWKCIVKKLRKWWFGEPVEVPKVIIRRHPRWYGRAWRGLSQCKVHMLPLAATITVVGLNWGTYFIGVDLPGWDTGQWQDFYRLALQVAAKLYVRPISLDTSNHVSNSVIGTPHRRLSRDGHHGHSTVLPRLQPNRPPIRHHHSKSPLR